MNFYKKLSFKKFFFNSFLGIIILSILSSCFYNFYNNNNNLYALKINEELISLKKFYNKLYIYEEKIKQNNRKISLYVNNNQEIESKIFEQALSKIINDSLLEGYVKKIGFSIQQKDVSKFITHLSYFQKNGKFNYEVYQKKLKLHNTNPKTYEIKLKQQLATKNFINYLIETDFLLNNEKKLILKLLTEKRLIKLSKINTFSLFKQEPVNLKEAKIFFENNKNIFVTPYNIKINYVKIIKNNIPIKIKNIEIKNWYLQNKFKFITPEYKKFSIIHSNNKNNLKKILKKLKINDNFSEMAKKYSLDLISDKKEGTLGWFDSKKLPKSINSAHLTKKGQISKIIKINSGYILIKLENIKPSRYRKLSEVKKNIIQCIKYQKQLSIFKKIISQINCQENQTLNSINLNKISKKIGSKIQKTNWINQNFIINDLKNKKIIQYLFNQHQKIKNKKFIKNIKIHNNLNYLIQIKKIKKEKNNNFNEVKNKIFMIIKNQKSRKKSLQIAKNNILELNQKKHSTFIKQKIKFKNEILISRNETNRIANTVFNLPFPNNKETVYSLGIKSNKDLFIIALIDVKHNKINFLEKKIISKYIKQYYLNKTLETLLKNLQRNAVIKYGKIFSIK